MKNMENKNILITGVAGLIGCRLADWIIKNQPDYNVIGIDDLSGGYIENVNNKVNFNKLNLVTDLDELSILFEKYSPKFVFHLAAYAAEGLSPFIRNFNYQNNLISTTNIINQCIKNNTERLIFTSSLAVYGHGEGGVFDENQTPKPIDPYGVAKYACEMDIQIAGEQHGLDWCIIRPHNVYGVKQNIWDKYRNVLGIWMYQHLNNQPMTIYGDGTQTRAFSYIDDNLEPFWNAAVLPQSSKEIINVGGIEEVSINDACDTLIDVIGNGHKVHLESRHEVKHSIPTYQKSIDILGYEYKTTLKEGLTNMWEWSQKQPNRDRFIWEKYELDKGIYSFWK
jgi:UDP-glucose 4-epimerase